jgi:glycosyltransferase involved in cell wall biosynthesis
MTTLSDSSSLSIVVPAYNEESTLRLVIEKLLRLPMLLEVVIVDDGSTDRTPDIADRLSLAHPQVRVIHQRNQGKTSAVKRGIQETRGNVVVIQDADTEYDSSEIPDLVQPILSGVADVVYGSRFLVRKAARVLYFYHYVANKAITFLSNLLTNINLSDVETGYKAFRGDIIRQMTITSTGFGFEIEVTAKLAKLGCAMYEVPISYYGRTYEQGKKITFFDAVASVWFIFRFNLFCTLRTSFRSLPELGECKRPEASSAQQS